jgi:hypothetical protein
MDKTSADRRLRAATIRLAYEKPELRVHLLPLLKQADGPDMEEMMAGRSWDGSEATPDDSVPYHKHKDSPSAGADGSAQRAKYNQWFRENVCLKTHKTNCGIGKD